MTTAPREHEFRRRPRGPISCPVTVEAGGRMLQGDTLDVSPFGAKLRIEERLQEGTAARLRFMPAEGRSIDIEAVVWRSDDDGPIFLFLKSAKGVLLPRQ